MATFNGTTSTGKNWTIVTDHLPKWARELPMWDRISEIVEALVTKRVSIIIAETGSGKSLLIQLIIGQLQEQGLIPLGEQILAQPLVETAKGLRETVEEITCEDVSLFTGPEKDRISGSRFSIGTAGSLVFRVKHATVTDIDEAHESHLDTIILEGAACLDSRQDPSKKIVYLSATFAEEDIADVRRLFDAENVATVEVEGRQYPLHREQWTINGSTFEDQIPGFLDNLVSRALPKLSGNRTALVFVPSPKYFPVLVDGLRKRLNGKFDCYEVITFSGADRGRQITPHVGWFDAVGWEGRRPKTVALEKYIRLGASYEQQSIVFNTDVFRTGISVMNVEVSASAGYQVRPYYNSAAGYGGTTEELTSEQGITQELGRAARFMKGYGFFVLAENRPARDIPAIRRHAMAQTVLRLISLGFDPLTFPFRNEPLPGAIAKSLGDLQEVQAIGTVEGKWQLTSVGRAMIHVNADPPLARSAIEADRQGCLPEMCIAIAERQGRGLFWNPEAAMKWQNQSFKNSWEIKAKQDLWRDSASDYLTAIKVWIGWMESGFDWNFGDDNGMYQKALQDMKRAALKMVDALDGISYEFNGDGRRTMRIRPDDLFKITEPDDTKKAAIGKSVLAGMPANLFRYYGRNAYSAIVREGGSYYIFPGSSAFTGQPKWLVGQFEAQRGQDPNHPYKFWLKGVHGVTDPVSWIKEVASHLLTTSITSTYYDADSDTVQAKRRLMLKGEEFGKDTIPLTGEEAVKVFANALTVGSVAHSCVAYNQAVMAEVEDLNRRIMGSLGTIDSSKLTLWYVSKLGSVHTLAEAQSLDLNLVDSDVSQLLGIEDYAAKRSKIKEERSDTWTIGGTQYSLVYNYSERWLEDCYVTLTLPIVVIKELTSEQLPSWDRVSIRIYVADKGYGDLYVEMTEIEKLREKMETRRQKLAWEAFKAEHDDYAAKVKVLYEAEMLEDRQPVEWDSVTGAMAYSAHVYYTTSEEVTVWYQRWHRSEEEAVKARESAKVEKIENDRKIYEKRNFEMLEAEAQKLYAEVKILWEQVDRNKYQLYGLSKNEADPNGWGYSESLSAKLEKGKSFAGLGYYTAQPSLAIESLNELKARIQQALDTLKENSVKEPEAKEWLELAKETAQKIEVLYDADEISYSVRREYRDALDEVQSLFDSWQYAAVIEKADAYITKAKSVVDEAEAKRQGAKVLEELLKRDYAKCPVCGEELYEGSTHYCSGHDALRATGIEYQKELKVSSIEENVVVRLIAEYDSSYNEYQVFLQVNRDVLPKSLNEVKTVSCWKQPGVRAQKLANQLREFRSELSQIEDARERAQREGSNRLILTFRQEANPKSGNLQWVAGDNPKYVVNDRSYDQPESDGEEWVCSLGRTLVETSHFRLIIVNPQIRLDHEIGIREEISRLEAELQSDTEEVVEAVPVIADDTTLEPIDTAEVAEVIGKTVEDVEDAFTLLANAFGKDKVSKRRK